MAEREPSFLSVDLVKQIHRAVLRKDGGDSGVLSEERLDSAVHAPQASFGGSYLNAFPFEMAAAYLISLGLNHAFVDGNKRVAAMAVVVFLDGSGYRLSCTSPDLVDLVYSVIDGRRDKQAVAAYLKEHSEPHPPAA